MSDDRTLLERQMQLVELRPFTLDGFHRQRNRRQRNRRIGAAVVALTVAAVAIGGLLRAISSGQVPAEEPAPTPTDLGIFEPVAGRILSGLWAVDPIAVDPSAPSRSTLVRLGPEEVLTLGWSSDGTELLFMREDQTDQTFPYPSHLYILQADGTETQLNRGAMEIDGAAIAPDGSSVVFGVADNGLFVVEAEGGRPVRIAGEGRSPTFSPDGTQIAYVVNSAVPGEAHLWVADADGSDAHEILADEPALVDGVDGLVWSPAGDRIAMGIDREGQVAIYTVAPDGSDLTKVISGGINPFWSPDGSQIAYMVPYDPPPGVGPPGLAIADADGSNVREFGFAASGPWHPGVAADEPRPSPTPTPTAEVVPSGSEAEQIIAEGTLASFAATGSGTTVLTVWAAETCEDWDVPDCSYAWRLGTGSQPLATGVLGGIHGGYVEANAASRDGFVLTPSRDTGGFLIAPDGTASPLSGDCRDATWSTPTEPRRLGWAPGLSFVDSVAGVICPTSQLGGRPLAGGVFTADGTLWALVDNETGPETLTIGNYDGTQWRYRALTPKGMSWESTLAAAGSNVVVLHARTRFIGLSVTTDAGATWHEVTDPNVLERDLPFSAYVSPDSEAWFSGYTSIAFAGTSVLYVADGRGDLWRSTDFTTFSQVEVAGGVSDLKPTGDAVIARLGDGNDLVHISADGSVKPITAR